jgi:hypothetical protein
MTGTDCKQSVAPKTAGSPLPKAMPHSALLRAGLGWIVAVPVRRDCLTTANGRLFEPPL